MFIATLEEGCEMRVWMRGATAFAVALVLAAAGCGGGDDEGGSTSAGTESGGREGGTVTVLMGTAPDFLDPQEGYTTQSAEATWISYRGSSRTRTRTAQPGGEVIPGLAKDFPKVSSDGRTYTLTLRWG